MMHAEKTALRLQKMDEKIAKLKYTTLLCKASRSGDLLSTEYLLESWYKVNDQKIHGFSILYLVCYECQCEEITSLLKPAADVNLAKTDETTPLLLASERGDTGIVKQLLDSEAKTESKITSLFIASQNGHTDVVKVLLDYGAEKETKTALGATPLFLASQNGHTDVVKVRLDYGAEKVGTTDVWATPLFIASMNGHADVVEVLLQYGAEKTETSHGVTPLYIAAKNGHDNVVRLLQEYGQNLHFDPAVEISAATDTVPIFCDAWRVSGKYSCVGGDLQMEDSNVRLSIPEGAVSRRISHEVVDPKKVTPRFTRHGITTAKYITERVIIQAAISTELQKVHQACEIAENEQIVSPVVEYFAQEVHKARELEENEVNCLLFKNPVYISLPHFMPPDFKEEDVRVYQFHVDGAGKVYVETLSRISPHKRMATEDSAGTSTDETDDGKSTGGFYFTEEREKVNIQTYHFSGYFCTTCKNEMDKVLLQLRLYGNLTFRSSPNVNLALMIWDLKLNIADFRKVSILSGLVSVIFCCSRWRFRFNLK